MKSTSDSGVIGYQRQRVSGMPPSHAAWALVCLLATILLLGGCSQSPQQREAKYLEKGKKELQKKNYGVAIIHFKNAMEAQPRDAEPYYQIGLAYLGANDINTAGSYFRKAADLNPKHTAAQLKLAEVMATARSKSIVEEAERRSEEVLKLLPDDPDALHVLATTELRLGKPASAESHLQQALRKSPTSLKSSVMLAQARLARQDVKGAEDALKQAIAEAPQSADARFFLGGFYLSTERTSDAEQEYQSALNINPRHGPSLLALGAMQVRAGQSGKAEETYRRVAALPDSQYKPAHALYLFQSGKTDQAIAELEKLTKADPADRNIRTDLVKSYLALNKVAEAERVLSAALKKNALDTDALMQRSRIYLASGKFSEAQTDLNQVLHYRNDSAEAHYLLSKVRQGRGELQLRKQELGETLKLDPAYLVARLELAQALIGSGGATAALEILDQAPEEQKDMAGIAVQRNWALLALGRVADARKGIDQVMAVKRVPEASLQDAALKLSQKDFNGARASAEEILKVDSGNTQALNMVVQTYTAQNQLAGAIQKVREYAAKDPGSAPMQQYLGQLLATSGDRAGARKAFEAAATAEPKYLNAQLALAELDLTDGNPDSARSRLTAVVNSQPGNLPAHLLFGQLEMAQGNQPAAIQAFRKGVEIDERNAFALNALAYLLAENKQPDEALKYAQKAKELAPDDASIDDTLGWTYFQKGLYQLAVTHLQDAIAKDGTARRRYHLAMAYLKAGDAKRGRQELDSALKLDPSMPEAQAARRAFGVN